MTADNGAQPLVRLTRFALPGALLAKETTFVARSDTADGCETNQRHVVRGRLEAEQILPFLMVII